jgi:hypothetical protein
MNSLLHQHKALGRLSLIREESTDANPANAIMNTNDEIVVQCQPTVETKRRVDVLRLGETIESFFQLSENSSPGYESLCRQLVASPTPTLWQQLLAMTTTRATSAMMDDDSNHHHLLRLYRRGTFLFPLDGPEQTAQVLAIWLDYARVQPVNEAKRTLQFVGHYEWTHAYAAYFLCRAAVEPHRAYEYLSQGLENQAEPRNDLQEALRSLQQNNDDDEPTRRLTTSRRAISSPSPNNLIASISDSTTTTSAKVPGNLRAKDTSVGMDQLETPSRQGLATSELQRDAPTPRATSKTIKLGSATSKPNRSRLEKEVSDRLAKRTDSADDPDAPNRLQGRKPPLAAKKDSILASKSKATSDKPDSNEDLSYILNWDPTKPTTTATEKAMDTRKRASNESTNSNEPLGGSAQGAQRINKKDLDYMFNWNPTARKSITKEATASGSPHRTTALNDSVVSNQCGKEVAAELFPARHAEQRPTQGADNSSVDPDFLPLVRRENIIRVNNIPYMKLGVIGKGGSCKVYRVMSKEGSILALKKVKVDKLDAMAIEGYANEIGLLKRLSKNPAIIHLHDSEVMPKKAIYMVMEVGEVDLNHVLHKQNRDGGLNINFVRLTWMQMLKAVHSMHEERIIHGA